MRLRKDKLNRLLFLEDVNTSLRAPVLHTENTTIFLWLLLLLFEQWEQRFQSSSAQCSEPLKDLLPRTPGRSRGQPSDKTHIQPFTIAFPNKKTHLQALKEHKTAISFLKNCFQIVSVCLYPAQISGFLICVGRTLLPFQNYLVTAG